jgi:hypothetical protein
MAMVSETIQDGVPDREDRDQPLGEDGFVNYLRSQGIELLDFWPIYIWENQIPKSKAQDRCLEFMLTATQEDLDRAIEQYHNHNRWFAENFHNGESSPQSPDEQ